MLVDGVDVRELDPDLLWSSIGLVPQKPYLFSGTVASNLRFGKPDATEAEMWEALEVAQAADFVRAMPGGLEARIEQGGTNVSGGQRQRLWRSPGRWCASPRSTSSTTRSRRSTSSPTRACAPPSSPTPATSAVVIVAQRVSTIATADEILVLEDGELVGRGTHDELIADLPDLRRDRAVPDRRAERGMTVIADDREPRGERGRRRGCNLAAPETRAAGRWGNSAGMPTEQSKDFGDVGPPPQPAPRPRAVDPRRRAA